MKIQVKDRFKEFPEPYKTWMNYMWWCAIGFIAGVVVTMVIYFMVG